MDLLAQLVYEYADPDTQRNILLAHNIPIGTYRSIHSAETWAKAKRHLEDELPKMLGRLHIYPDSAEVILSNGYTIHHVPMILTIGMVCSNIGSDDSDNNVDWMIGKQFKPCFYSASHMIDNLIYTIDLVNTPLKEYYQYLEKSWDSRYVPIWKNKLESQIDSDMKSINIMNEKIRTEEKVYSWEWSHYEGCNIRISRLQSVLDFINSYTENE